MRSTIRPATRRPAILAFVATVAVVLGACAGAATQSVSGGDTLAPVPAVGAPEMATAGPIAADGNGYVVGRVDQVAPDGTITKGDAYAATDTKVIKTGSLSMEVDEIDPAVDAARTAIVALGGYVSGTSAYDQGSQKYAAITYRIPAERWDEALTALRRIGTKILDEQTGAVEVTSQVVDLDARIRNLKATETQLLGIMTKATRIADILAVQTQLTDVRGQIEQLTAQLKQLEDQAALGTLTVMFSVPVAAIDAAGRDWDLGKQLDGAVAALLALGQFAVSAAIWLVVVGLPALIGLAILYAVVRALARVAGVELPRLRRRRAA